MGLCGKRPKGTENTRKQPIPDYFKAIGSLGLGLFGKGSLGLYMYVCGLSLVLGYCFVNDVPTSLVLAIRVVAKYVLYVDCRSGSSWLRAVPWGLRKLLGWIKDEFGNPPVYITENGVSDNNGTLRDHHRIDFYSSYINNVLKG